MGWFSSSKPSSSASGGDDTDPLRNLDPDLRAFLEKESPVKYKPTSAPPAPQPTLKEPILSISAQTPDHSAPPPVPSQSLYPDGRYAHLWRTYTPLHEIENATKTDQEKLLDVLEGYKQRKADIGRAALENCALEQGAISECITNGGMRARMTMCRQENRDFERCYTMQNRFLKALGYLSAYDRSASVDEDIQMHADTLYHRMLDQEKAQKEAEEKGLPIPQFPPMIPKPRSAGAPSSLPSPIEAEAAAQTRTAAGTVEAVAKGQTLESLTPEARKELEKRMKDKPQIIRELEERAMMAEAESDVSVARRVTALQMSEKERRKDRREKGEASIGDTVSGWLGW